MENKTKSALSYCAALVLVLLSISKPNLIHYATYCLICGFIIEWRNAK